MIIMVKMQAKLFDIDLTQVYTHTSDNSDSEMEAFYDEIESTLKCTKPGEISLFSGDFNTKIGNVKRYSMTRKYGN